MVRKLIHQKKVDNSDISGGRRLFERLEFVAVVSLRTLCY